MDNLEEQIGVLVERLARGMQQKDWMLACAESCTGGLLSKSCTDLAGSSCWFDRAFITYSNEAKTQMLDVPQELIQQQGAVSEEVAAAMVQGIMNKTKVEIAVSITGIAGPGGGSPEKPVGTVCFGFAVRGQQVEVCSEQFAGDRNQVRHNSVVYVLNKLLKLLG